MFQTLDRYRFPKIYIGPDLEELKVSKSMLKEVLHIGLMALHIGQILPVLLRLRISPSLTTILLFLSSLVNL